VKGIGAGSFEFWWAREGSGEYVRDAHSLYLETLGELGLPGLILVLALLGLLAAAVLRGRRAADRSATIAASTGLGAAFCVYIFFAGVDWMWESTAVTVLALGAATVAAAPAAELGRHRRRLSLDRLSVVLLAVVAGGAQVPAIVGTERIRASQFDRLVGDLGGAERAADDAIDAEPWAASPYAERAVVALAEGDYEEARENARRAIAREPTYWWHRHLLMRVQTARQDEEAALAALAQARRLYPEIGISRESVRDAVAGQDDALSPAGPG
jgi:tetratricopeptide (TPR) repeat protein